MVMRPALYIPLTYLLATIPYIWLAIIAWRRRPAVAVEPFAQAMVCMAIWTFTYSIELFSQDITTKLICTQIEFLGIIGVPVFFLRFTVEYTGNQHLLTLKTRMLIWILPLVTLIIAWTNSFHHLMWTHETLIESPVGLKLLDLILGPFFWLLAVYSYVLLAAACVLLIMELVRRPGIYRAQISFIVLSIVIPSLGSVIFVSGFGPFHDLDMTPLFFLPTALGLFWAIAKYKLLDILPPEHITILKSMKDGVVVLNSQDRILYLNLVMEKLLGRSEGEVIGQPLSKISALYYEKLEPYLSGADQRVEIKVGDGNQAKIFEVTVSPIQQGKPRTARSMDRMVMLHDATRRKETEALLRRKDAIMSSISTATAQFLKASTWEHNIPDVLKVLGQSADVSRVSVVMNYQENEGGTVFASLCYEWSAPNIVSQLNNPSLIYTPLSHLGLSRWTNILSNREPILGQVDDFPEEEKVFLKTLGTLSLVVVPIFAENHWWGFIMFEECERERQWSPVEIEAFEAVANIFGAAEARARAEQQIVRRQHALSLLHQIVTVSLQAKELDEMADIVVNRLRELIGADGCFITLWDEEHQRPIPLVAYGIPKEKYAAIEIQPDQRNFTASALKAGHTLVVEDTETTSFAEPEIVHLFPSKSGIVLPLIADKKNLGAIILAFNKKQSFSNDDISICEQAAALIALALEKFQSVDEAKRRADTSEKLRKASLAVAEKLEMDQTVSHILDQLRQVVPYDSASVQLIQGNELVIVDGRGWDNPKDVRGMRFVIPGNNPNSVVIQTGKPYQLPEVWKVYEQFNHPPHNHIRSWLGVPLIVQEKVIGLLAIDSSEPNHFRDKDIQTATEFSNQVAVALENARIYQESQTQAITDVLTGVYNRRGIFQLGEFEFQRSRRISRPFCILMMDIDHFKQVNDQYGHSAGDQVLHEFAKRNSGNLRTTDLIGRYGGEEFMVLLPETSLEAARAIAERMRMAIMNFPFDTEKTGLRITSSFGAAEAEGNDTFLDLIEKADAALYQAKRNGRNCVVAYGMIDGLPQTADHS